jgi:hypothetical protein
MEPQQAEETREGTQPRQQPTGPQEGTHPVAQDNLSSAPNFLDPTILFKFQEWMGAIFQSPT